MLFWQFYWSSITDNPDTKEEYIRLYERNKTEYPDLMKTMSIAFDYFNNGVDFISEQMQ